MQSMNYFYKSRGWPMLTLRMLLYNKNSTIRFRAVIKYLKQYNSATAAVSSILASAYID